MPILVDATGQRSGFGSGVWWGLWSAFASLPWLLPTHAQPWTGFHADATMAAVGALLLAYVVLTGPSRFEVPLETLVLFALGLVPLVQLRAGLIVFAGDAWLATIYVFSLGAAVAAGTRVQQLQPWALPNALFASFGIASIASVVLMVLQWVHWDGLGTLLLSLPAGDRLSANLGQPNQLATLLIWGLLALWWAHLHSRVHGLIVWVLAAFVLAGVSMTQSRAGALQVVMLAVAALQFRKQLRVRDYVFPLVALGAWFIISTLVWASINEVLRPGQLPTLPERLAPGTRLLHWSVLLDAVAKQPWFGWGWNQIVHAQGQFAPLHPASHEVIQYAHNVVFDLILWNGAPIGILVSLVIAAWCVRQYRLALSSEHVLVLLSVAVFIVHAMFELPHGYIVFLVPVGLLAGVLHVRLDRFRSVTLNGRLVALPAAALVLSGVLIIWDYSQLEDAWMAHRFRAGRIGTTEDAPLPPTTMLSNLHSLLRFSRTEPRASMSTEEATLLRQVAQRYPSAGGLFRHAWALALKGELADARRTLVLLCRVHSKAQCSAAQEAWLAKAEQERPQAALAWPSSP